MTKMMNLTKQYSEQQKQVAALTQQNVILHSQNENYKTQLAVLTQQNYLLKIQVSVLVEEVDRKEMMVQFLSTTVEMPVLEIDTKYTAMFEKYGKFVPQEEEDGEGDVEEKEDGEEDGEGDGEEDEVVKEDKQ
jgi:hypothetical protein